MTSEIFDPEFIESLRRQIEETKTQLAAEPAGLGLVPLRLQCSFTSCKHGRHCLDYLRRPHKGDHATPPGTCRDCEQQVIDFGRLHPNAEPTSEIICEQILGQQHELIRAHYWHVSIDQWAYNQARRLGMRELLRRMDARVRFTLVDPGAYAGRGASYSQQILAYAQHATATCCRRCAAYWHGMPTDLQEAPSTAQLKHAMSAARLYLKVRLPEVQSEPEPGVRAIQTWQLLSPGDRSNVEEDILSRFGAGEDPVGFLVPRDTTLHVQAHRRSLVLARSLDFSTAS